ncbi:MAG TPA: A24 family peptidase [Candidatus Limnocylindria bacterium]|nr:A24 family peptidase [Candidatus Limnocylindria bacterium]
MDRPPGRHGLRGATPRVSSGPSLDPRTTLHGITIHEVARRLAEISKPVPLACSAGLAIAFALLAFRRFGFAPRWWLVLPLLGALAVIVVLDLRIRIIPDIITLPGLAYALGLAAVSAWDPTVIEAGLGALVGGGVVLLVAIVSRGGMGGGDIKLMAMLGAALEWRDALIVLAFSQVVGAIIVLGVLVVRRRRPTRHLPVGALIALFGAIFLIYSP